MPYTDEEVAMAKTKFEQAQARGKGRPMAIAVMVGLSRPNERRVVSHQPSYRDFLARARAKLKKCKQGPTVS